MRSGNYYSIRNKRRNTQGIVIGILAAILLILLIVIIWAIATFAGGGEGAFLDQSSQISGLKIENESLRLENEDLKKENAALKADIEKYRSGEYTAEQNPDSGKEPEESAGDEKAPEATPEAGQDYETDAEASPAPDYSGDGTVY